LVVSGQKLSQEAQNSKKTSDLWGCFVTNEIMEIILLHTNEKILENHQQRNYSRVRLRKSPHLQETDLVK
jgi:hypothetical protein